MGKITESSFSKSEQSHKVAHQQQFNSELLKNLISACQLSENEAHIVTYCLSFGHHKESNGTLDEFTSGFPDLPYFKKLLRYLDTYSAISQQIWFYGKPIVGWRALDKRSEFDDLDTLGFYIDILFALQNLKRIAFTKMGFETSSLVSSNFLLPLGLGVPISCAMLHPFGENKEVSSYLRKCKSKDRPVDANLILKNYLRSFNMEEDTKKDWRNNSIALFRVCNSLVRGMCLSKTSLNESATVNLANLLSYVFQMDTPGKELQLFSPEILKQLHNKEITHEISYPGRRTWMDFIRHSKGFISEQLLELNKPIETQLLPNGETVLRSEILKILKEIVVLACIFKEVSKLEDCPYETSQTFEYLTFHVLKYLEYSYLPDSSVDPYLKSLFERTGIYNSITLVGDTGLEIITTKRAL